MVTFVGVIFSNSKSRAVMELKIDSLTEEVEKHNRLIERTYKLEQDVAVAQNDIETFYHSRIPDGVIAQQYGLANRRISVAEHLVF